MKNIGRFLNYSLGWYLFVMLAFCVATAWVGSFVLAGVELGVTLVMLVVYFIYRGRRRRELKDFVQKIADKMNGEDGAESPFPILVVRLSDGGILHVNNAFAKLADFSDAMTERNLDSVFPDMDLEWLSSGRSEYPYDVTLDDRRYRIYGSMIRANDRHETALGVLYLSDLTDLYQVRDEYIRSRPVVAIVLVDNYEELTRNMSEGAISALNSRINNLIMKWAQSYQGLLRRLEKNRFLMVFEKRDLKQAEDSKFAILEDIHNITSPSGVSASLSIGLGVDAATFEEGYEFASLSIEMALSRGGDQAVIKDRLSFQFFGGRNKETDQRSQVRSRVTANSLMELIGQSSHIFVMGHKNADLDAVGAALGICAMCRKKGKTARIVMDMENNSSKLFLSEVLRTPEYKKAFISGEDALLEADNRSTLIVVDTNRPDQVEYKALLESVPRVCVVDHHRRAADYIKTVVELLDTSASSASELTTELLQYSVDTKDILPIEAKGLLAGIFLDTKSFNVRTGEGTFRAAAFLRQLGADTVDVKRLLQSDFDSTIAKHEIMESARLYHENIAVAKVDKPTTRALAAQAADELLNICGIAASFVLYPDGDQVFVSGRSIGDANVQMILEPLGGGGNSETAGAQIKDRTVNEVLRMLTDSIDQYYES